MTDDLTKEIKKITGMAALHGTSLQPLDSTFIEKIDSVVDQKNRAHMLKLSQRHTEYKQRYHALTDQCTKLHKTSDALEDAISLGAGTDQIEQWRNDVRGSNDDTF